MIMALQAGDRLLSLTDLSEVLGIPVHTLYRWRDKGQPPTLHPKYLFDPVYQENIDNWFALTLAVAV